MVKVAKGKEAGVPLASKFAYWAYGMVVAKPQPVVQPVAQPMAPVQPVAQPIAPAQPVAPAQSIETKPYVPPVVPASEVEDDEPEETEEESYLEPKEKKGFWGWVKKITEGFEAPGDEEI